MGYMIDNFLAKIFESKASNFIGAVLIVFCLSAYLLTLLTGVIGFIWSLF